MGDACTLLLRLLHGGARFIPLVVVTPLFGGRHLPAPVRIGLACALGLCVNGPPDAGGGGDWSMAGTTAEVVLGLTLALPVLFIIKGIEIAGQCFDQVCGTNAIEILFPSGGTAPRRWRRSLASS